MWTLCFSTWSLTVVFGPTPWWGFLSTTHWGLRRATTSSTRVCCPSGTGLWLEVLFSCSLCLHSLHCSWWQRRGGAGGGGGGGCQGIQNVFNLIIELCVSVFKRLPASSDKTTLKDTQLNCSHSYNNLLPPPLTHMHAHTHVCMHTYARWDHPEQIPINSDMSCFRWLSEFRLVGECGSLQFPVWCAGSLISCCSGDQYSDLRHHHESEKPVEATDRNALPQDCRCHGRNWWRNSRTGRERWLKAHAVKWTGGQWYGSVPSVLYFCCVRIVLLSLAEVTLLYE